MFVRELGGTNMHTHDVFMDDGVTVSREECERRSNEVEDFFHRLNASSLLTLLFQNFGEVVFDRDQVTHLNKYDLPPNDTAVNPYDPDFFDYIKDLGGHVVVKFDPQTDKVSMNLVSHEDGIEAQKKRETMGFFSIRRPWNVHSIKPVQGEIK